MEDQGLRLRLMELIAGENKVKGVKHFSRRIATEKRFRIFSDAGH